MDVGKEMEKIEICPKCGGSSFVGQATKLGYSVECIDCGEIVDTFFDTEPAEEIPEDVAKTIFDISDVPYDIGEDDDDFECEDCKLI